MTTMMGDGKELACCSSFLLFSGTYPVQLELRESIARWSAEEYGNPSMEHGYGAGNIQVGLDKVRSRASSFSLHT